MDPYVTVQIGKQKKSTQICKDGDKCPIFNETLSFDINNDELIKFSILEQDIGINDLIGEKQMLIQNIIDDMENRSIHEQLVELLFEGQVVGNISVSYTWTQENLQSDIKTSPNSQIQQFQLSISDIQVTIQNQQSFDKPDVYIKLVYGKQTFNTKTINDITTSAKFSDIISFKLVETESKIQFEIYDQDTFSDDLLGRGIFDISVMKETQQTIFVSLKDIKSAFNSNQDSNFSSNNKQIIGTLQCKINNPKVKKEVRLENESQEDFTKKMVSDASAQQQPKIQLSQMTKSEAPTQQQSKGQLSQQMKQDAILQQQPKASQPQQSKSNVVQQQQQWGKVQPSQQLYQQQQQQEYNQPQKQKIKLASSQSQASGLEQKLKIDESRPSQSISLNKNHDSNIYNTSSISTDQIKHGKMIISQIRALFNGIKESECEIQEQYCVFKLGNQSKQSEIITENTYKPQWNDSIELARTIEEDLIIEVHQKAKDQYQAIQDWISSVFIKVRQYLQGGKFKLQQGKLVKDVQKFGIIYFDLEYIPPQFEKKFLKNRSSIFQNTHEVSFQQNTSSEYQKKQELLQFRRELMKPQSERFDQALPKIKLYHNNKYSSQENSSKKRVETTNEIDGFPSIKRIKDPKLYKKQIYGYGMSNQHSAYSLQHSVPIFSFPKNQRFPNNQYKGYDGMLFQAETSFLSNELLKQKAKIIGRGGIKGAFIGYGRRYDFTSQFKSNPGPGDYGESLTDDIIVLKK